MLCATLHCLLHRELAASEIVGRIEVLLTQLHVVPRGTSSDPRLWRPREQPPRSCSGDHNEHYGRDKHVEYRPCSGAFLA